MRHYSPKWDTGGETSDAGSRSHRVSDPQFNAVDKPRGNAPTTTGVMPTSTRDQGEQNQLRPHDFHHSDPWQRVECWSRNRNARQGLLCQNRYLQRRVRRLVTGMALATVSAVVALTMRGRSDSRLGATFTHIAACQAKYLPPSQRQQREASRDWVRPESHHSILSQPELRVNRGYQPAFARPPRLGFPYVTFLRGCGRVPPSSALMPACRFSSRT